MFSTFLNGDDGGSLKEREKRRGSENKHFAAIITDDRDWNLYGPELGSDHNLRGEIIQFISIR